MSRLLTIHTAKIDFHQTGGSQIQNLLKAIYVTHGQGQVKMTMVSVEYYLECQVFGPYTNGYEGVGVWGCVGLCGGGG